VLVAVRSPRMREALVALIGSLDGFAVVAEASSDEQALDLARRHRPHLALVDQELPGCDGDWAIQRLQRDHLAGAVVAIGRRADGSRRARAVGACAYVQVGAPPAEILRALASALARLGP
jgi:DNA-binding NarL/FixJ family response regulator